MKTLSQIKDWSEAINTVVHGDSLELMKMIPDNAIDLCLTDPPYGIGSNITYRKNSYSKITRTNDYGNYKWNDEIPKKEIFDEIFRISKNQIIFGANHFMENMPLSSSCWIVWDKDNHSSTFADCELAWTSFKTAVRKFKWRWNGMLQENMGRHKEQRFHPTQKPLELMRWCLQNYAKDCKTIIDPFAGSFTTARACKDMGFDWIAIDQEKKYCEAGEKRLEQMVLV